MKYVGQKSKDSRQIFKSLKARFLLHIENFLFSVISDVKIHDYDCSGKNLNTFWKAIVN